MKEQDKYVFQVNLKGMIALLSEHLYSDPNTFIRELLQNGVDAITAMQHLDPAYKGNIRVLLDEQPVQLQFADNGIGLTEEEIHKFIAVIGESSKRNSVDASDFIGKFGIGLLSCFVVSEDIVLETRSALSSQALRWTGRADGTYFIETISEERSIGTHVVLTPKKEWLHLFTKAALEKSLKYFGDLLPVTITLETSDGSVVVNPVAGQWMQESCSRQDLLEIGKAVFHTDFTDAFRVRTEAGRVNMIVYILPYKTQFSGKQSHRLYLKRMFLADDDCRLLPRWAFFVKCLINTDGLNATASRESLMVNEVLKAAQKEINAQIKDYLKNIIHTDPEVYARLIQTHYLHLKALAAEDTELLKIFIKDLPFETNKGVRTFANIRQYQDHIYYASNVDDFKQLKRVAESQGVLIINAGYTFEEEILKKMQQLDRDVRIKPIEAEDILGSFGEPSATQQAQFLAFKNQAEPILGALNCSLLFRSFQPEDIPAMYFTSVQIMAQQKQTGLSAKNPMASVLGAFGHKKAPAMRPQLCFNTNNPLVNNLAAINDTFMIQSIVHIIYVQSLLLGKYPVSDKEMSLFNEGVQNLLVMGIDNFINI